MQQNRKTEFTNIIEAALQKSKAEDITVIDLTGKDTICDAMYIATGSSSRSVKAIADHIVLAFKERNITNVNVEGEENCQWVLIDTGPIIVHIFQRGAREYYNLEELWTKLAK